jgi:sugar lactone lactonase YvrE
MFATRADSFVHRARRALTRDDAWPALPAGIVLDRVVGVAVDSRGRVYVAHRGGHPLLRFHADGSFDREIGAGHMRVSTAYDLRGPTPIPIATRCWMHGLSVDARDHVWITDVGRHIAMRFDADGELRQILGTDGQAGCDATHFNQPTHVCAARNGDLYVTDGYGNSRVVQLRSDGTLVRAWGGRGTAPGEFHTPHIVTQDAEGLLYVSDRENDRIQVFRESGEVVAVWSDLHSIDGLTLGPDGFVYASCGIDNALLRLTRDGRVLDVWVLPGLRYPHAVAVDREQRLHVAETGDRWEVTGRGPDDRRPVERNGPEGSRISRFALPRG